MIDRFPRVEVTSRQEWRDWLTEHHADHGTIWLVTYKKHVADRHLPWSEVVDEALCFGWIDSRPARLDEDRTMVLVSPRKPGSVWSKVNREKVERLMAEGRMAPAGMTAVLRAQADGSWSALEDVDAMVVPPALESALAADPVAQGFWNGFPPGVRRNILQWIAGAKTEGTRARRIEETVRLAAQNIRANHPRPKT